MISINRNVGPVPSVIVITDLARMVTFCHLDISIEDHCGRSFYGANPA